MMTRKRKQNKSQLTTTTKRRNKNHEVITKPPSNCPAVKSLFEAKDSTENKSFTGLNYDLMSDLFKGSDISEVARILNDSPLDKSEFLSQIEDSDKAHDISTAKAQSSSNNLSQNANPQKSPASAPVAQENEGASSEHIGSSQSELQISKKSVVDCHRVYCDVNNKMKGTFSVQNTPAKENNQIDTNQHEMQQVHEESSALLTLGLAEPEPEPSIIAMENSITVECESLIIFPISSNETRLDHEGTIFKNRQTHDDTYSQSVITSSGTENTLKKSIQIVTLPEVRGNNENVLSKPIVVSLSTLVAPETSKESAVDRYNISDCVNLIKEPLLELNTIVRENDQIFAQSPEKHQENEKSSPPIIAEPGPSLENNGPSDVAIPVNQPIDIINFSTDKTSQGHGLIYNNTQTNEDTVLESFAESYTSPKESVHVLVPSPSLLQENCETSPRVIIIQETINQSTNEIVTADDNLTDCESPNKSNISTNIPSRGQVVVSPLGIENEKMFCASPRSRIISSPKPGPSNSSISDDKNYRQRQVGDFESSHESESLADDSDADPNFEAHNQESGSEADESMSSLDHSESEAITRTRKKRANPAGWKRNRAKLLRNSGQQYTTSKGKLIPPRTMGQPCGSSCRLKCSENFTEQERQEYFDRYWSLKNINKQRQVILKSLQAIHPKYRYPVQNSSRKVNHAFYIYKGEGKIRVCKKFYVSTFGITNRCIRTVIEKTKEGFLTEDLRGKHDKHATVAEDVKNVARNHIASIPTVESHYTRADTTKQYIEGGRTLKDIYRDYKLQCENENREKVSFAIFRQIFNYEFNLDFFKPKKDLCQFCESYKNMRQDERLDKELEYMKHHEEKNLSRTEKEKDKERINKNYKVACYDLQAALPTPKGEVSTFYYKSKLSTYNFTICDLNNKGLGTVNCYLWHEGEGHKGSNEIGSCLIHYLKSCSAVQDDGSHSEYSNDTEVIFYSDNCGGQGKNKFVIGAYMYAVANFNIKSITHKFLVVGHTQNEGDVSHSLIEKNIKKALKSGPIYLPSQYATLVSTARKSGEPFKVHQLEHQFFYDLKDLVESTTTNFNVNDEGEKFNFNDICVIKVEKDNPGVYFYKTSFKDEEYKTVNVTRSRTRKQLILFRGISLKKAYSESISISQRKYRDLMSLVNSNTIPRCHATFFENLKYE